MTRYYKKPSTIEPGELAPSRTTKIKSRGQKRADDQIANLKPDEEFDDGNPPWGGHSTTKVKYGQTLPHSHGGSTFPRCYDKHPELALGGGIVLGGSCNTPRTGFEVYVGFDSGMRVTPQNPWNAPNPDAPVQGKLEITDGSVPKDKAEFDRMLDYLIEQLAAGKRVHIGCIGGHGRTGLVLAALVARINGEKAAIQWVRKHHCKKAVETKGQVEWLMKHYGVDTADASKGWSQSDWSGKYDKHKHPGDKYDTGGGMGLSGKGKGGKAIVGGGSLSSSLGEGVRLTPLDGPTRLFRPA